jgi:hypothetical protein
MGTSRGSTTSSPRHGNSEAKLARSLAYLGVTPNTARRGHGSSHHGTQGSPVSARLLTQLRWSLSSAASTSSSPRSSAGTCSVSPWERVQHDSTGKLWVT